MYDPATLILSRSSLSSPDEGLTYSLNDEDIEKHSDMQAAILFSLLGRYFSREWMQALIEDEIQVHFGETGLDMVHLAAYGGLYGLINTVMIDELDYDVDFY